jgi:hypothetical protein
MVGRLYLHPTWAPDGRSLAFVGLSGSSQTDMEASLYTSASDGKELILATQNDVGEGELVLVVEISKNQFLGISLGEECGLGEKLIGLWQPLKYGGR